MSQPARVLVVDDEKNIRLTLSTLIQRAGYDVTSAEGGAEAIGLLSTQRYDLLLVDLKMPEIDGMQVVAAARQQDADLAIIVLTGHGSLDTAVEGIQFNIFDYLLKTTEPSQVVERVRAGLAAHADAQRRKNLLDTVDMAVRELRGGRPLDGSGTGTTERVVIVGPLQLDTWRQLASLNNKTLPLTPTEFRVLLCLAEHVGTMMGYAQLVKCAQGYEASELEAGELIKPHIHHLRQKLEPDPSQPRYILNVRGKGYLLSVVGE
ncbi:MAG: response regulator transcription factor [Roseiflexaceae bacterium]|nr:response regulator transcription factor [Roseiflexaceae bacterium]